MLRVMYTFNMMILNYLRSLKFEQINQAIIRRKLLTKFKMLYFTKIVFLSNSSESILKLEFGQLNVLK